MRQVRLREPSLKIKSAWPRLIVDIMELRAPHETDPLLRSVKQVGVLIFPFFFYEMCWQDPDCITVTTLQFVIPVDVDRETDKGLFH